MGNKGFAAVTLQRPKKVVKQTEARPGPHYRRSPFRPKKSPGKENRNNPFMSTTEASGVIGGRVVDTQGIARWASRFQ